MTPPMPDRGEREGKLSEAAERVVEIYNGLAEDANDGEFALWSQTDLIIAIVALGLNLTPHPGASGHQADAGDSGWSVVTPVPPRSVALVRQLRFEWWDGWYSGVIVGLLVATALFVVCSLVWP